MTMNLLESEAEFQQDFISCYTFLKNTGSQNLSVAKINVISRNTEYRNNKVRVLKSTPNTHKYKQYSIPA